MSIEKTEWSSRALTGQNAWLKRNVEPRERATNALGLQRSRHRYWALSDPKNYSFVKGYVCESRLGDRHLIGRELFRDTEMTAVPTLIGALGVVG